MSGRRSPGRAFTRIVFKLVLLPDSEPLFVEIDQPGTHARVHLGECFLRQVAKTRLATEPL